MKRIILLIAVAILATSCEYIPSGYIPKEIGDEYEVNISEIEHAGHSYLLFEGYGVIHDPNCSCQRVSEE